MKRGKYIAIEGVDGAGTTTMTRLLSERIGAKAVKEPGSFLEPAIRQTIAHYHGEEQRTAACLLFAADRLLLRPVIDRHLAHGIDVVSDRCYLSSLVYQPDEHRQRAWVVSLQRGILLPDVIVYLKVTPETAMLRIAHRTKRDAYETEAMVRRHVARYDELAADSEYGRGIVTVDAEADIDTTLARILSALKDHV